MTCFNKNEHSIKILHSFFTLEWETAKIDMICYDELIG